MKRRSTFLMIVLGFGFAFFYIPILSMIVYSFNASRLATVWGGFSTKWYVSLLSNQQVLDALVLSLKIAVVSATVAEITAIFSDSNSASITLSFDNSETYHLVENPPQTVARREALKL